MNSKQRKELIRTVAEKFVQRDHFDSIEWKIQREGKDFSAGFVSRNEDFQRESNLIYRIYSMTKPIVSVAAIKAIEMGLLRLYDPVAMYFDCFKSQMVLTASGVVEHAKTLINIEQLLTHKSGLSYGFNTGCAVGNLYARAGIIHKSHLDLDSFVSEISRFPLAFHPGEGWRYSLSTDVLAGVLEKVFGKGIDEILKEIIFDPIDMKETSFFVTGKEKSRIAKIYGKENIDDPAIFSSKFNKLDVANIEDIYPSDQTLVKARGGHGLFSTIGDYNKFATMLCTGLDKYGHPFISDRMMNFALLNRVDSKYRPLVIDSYEIPFDGYGYNLLGRVMVDQSKARFLTGRNEFGWSGAASTYFWVDRDENLTGVIMAQYLGSTIPFAEEIKSTVYQAL